MAQGLSFHYNEGESFLHRSDTRLKFFLYIAVNFSLSMSPILSVLVQMILFLLLAMLLKIRLLKIAGELRGFLFIFAVNFIGQAHFTGGQQIALTPLPFLDDLRISISWNPEGAKNSVKFILQLSASLLTTHLLMLTTKLADLQLGLYKIFRILNKKAAWIFCSMLRVMLSSIPLIFDSARSGAEAMRMKGLNPKKHPLQYTRLITLSLLNAVYGLTDAYTKALLIRGWKMSGPNTASMDRDQSTGPNVITAVCGTVLLAGSIVINFIYS